jgi:UDP-N-acetylmuramoyl-tripeptide--D-alanyl-D-alanine ligase
MIRLAASEIAKIVGGVLHGSDTPVMAPAQIASASCTEGSIFIALKGERVDGHDFIEDAFEHGAVLALVDHQVAQRCIVVGDVTLALATLARHVREKLPELTVIGITGSQGKTTTKELLFSVLSGKNATVAPSGNHNNELGVPLTLLLCDEETKFCIVEMGARHIGDISHLCSIAQPDIGVVLRVAAAHLGEFGSIENIAQAKSEMISGLNGKGIAIVGDYDPFTPQMKSIHPSKTFLFGEKPHDDIRAADIELRDGRAHFDLVTPDGRSPVALRLLGVHQIANALAAATVAHALGMNSEEISGALSLAQSHASWRMELHELPDLLLIKDSYNASPDSMEAALRTLAHLSQERGGESWAFVGKMAELGESSPAEHASIGTLASEIGIDHLVAIAAPEYGGALSGSGVTSLHICRDRSQALELLAYMNRGDVVLIKASRSEKFEELAREIENFWLKKIENETAEKS